MFKSSKINQIYKKRNGFPADVKTSPLSRLRRGAIIIMVDIGLASGMALGSESAILMIGKGYS